MENLLEIKNLRVVYKTERATGQALNGMSITLKPGESLGLVGEAGAGKTTTALSILNLLPRAGHILEGEVLFHGKNVLKMSKKELQNMRGHQISMIFQNPLTSLNPVFTVGEQIEMVLRHHLHMKPKQAEERAKKLLESVGIPAYRLHEYPVQFSGGMRQRVGIAAGIACNPELLIADEPTTALDVTIQAQILELMKLLQEQHKTSLLMITHNLGIISELCENVAVMYAGRVIEYGSVEEVFAHPSHPYTRGLLGALPDMEKNQERLTSIPGTVADAQNLPEGCRFHPRCEHCMEQCRFKQPYPIALNDRHMVECFMYEGGDGQ